MPVPSFVSMRNVQHANAVLATIHNDSVDFMSHLLRRPVGEIQQMQRSGLATACVSYNSS